MQPINYNVAVADPFRSGLEGYAIGQQLGQQAVAQREAPLRAAAAQEALGAYVGNPTPTTWLMAAAANPQLKDILEKQWAAQAEEQKRGTMQFAGQVYAAADRNPELAAQLLTDRAAAARNAGDEQSARLFETYAKIAPNDPNAVKAFAGMYMGTADPDGFKNVYETLSTSRRTEALLPSEIAKGEAEAAKAGVEAAYAPEAAQSEITYKQALTDRTYAMTEQEAEKIGIARDTLAFEMDKYIEQQAKDAEAGAGFAKLSQGMEKAVDEAVVAAGAASTKAQTAKQFAQQYRELSSGGLAPRIADSLKQGFLGQRELLRTQVAGLLNQQVVSMLPPGPATDRDIAIMKEGVPSAYDNPEKVARFLDAVARTEERVALSQSARASWISQNGNSGDARKDMVIDGREVSRGMTFPQFMRIVAMAEARGGR